MRGPTWDLRIVLNCRPLLCSNFNALNTVVSCEREGNDKKQIPKFKNQRLRFHVRAGNSCSPLLPQHCHCDPSFPHHHHHLHVTFRVKINLSNLSNLNVHPTQLHHGRAGLREPAADLDEHRLPQVLCEWQHQGQTTDTQWCLRQHKFTLYY